MVKRAVCYSFSLNADEPMAYLRLTAPLREAGIEIINGFAQGQADVDAVRTADVVVFQREFPTQFETYQKISTLARQAGKPIIFEVDDLLFFLPDVHPDRGKDYYGSTLFPMLQALLEADLVTVTTSTLREALVAYNSNVVVLPNIFDEQVWRLSPPTRKTPQEPLIIGFMGTNSHKPDLAYLTPVLLDLAERYPERLQFHFWGASPPPELKDLSQTQWHAQYFASYPEFATFFQTQTADIFIAPLLNNLFNRCKSAIKFFEYSALGVPGIFSRLEPYTAVITHRHDGLLASSLDEWHAGLVQLIEDDELRFRLATNAQATIQEKWRLSQHAPRWQEAYSQAGTSPSQSRLSVPMSEMFNSINLQLFETFQRKAELEKTLREHITAKEFAIQNLNNQMGQRDHTIRELTAQLNHARNEIEQLEAEVLGYVLSKSWRMTRPFRATGRKLKKILRTGHV